MLLESGKSESNTLLLTAASSARNPASSAIGWKSYTNQLQSERLRALPYAEMPAFMHELAGRKEVAARCLEFTIYTAARTSEAIDARWSEIDLDAGVWTVPPERIKSGSEHRVPLSLAAIAVLKGQRGRDSELVFPGMKEGRSLSNMAMLELLQGDMGKSVTVHGFRSTFRDFAADCTNYPREIAEAALAHTLKDETETAYRRSDLFDKRRKLMNVWAKHCTKPTLELSSSRGHRRPQRPPASNPK